MRKEILVGILSRHVGHANGISADELAKQMDCLPRAVREAVSWARQAGIAVCGTPEAGYFIAATADELEETCQFLRSRAMHSLVLESKLRNVPLEDLIGQMRLST